MNAQTVKMAKVASPSRANKNNNSKKKDDRKRNIFIASLRCLCHVFVCLN